MVAAFPEAFQFLFEPARYKCAYGGRGAGKSQSFARALLIQGVQKPLRILCTRELQRSISESVHKLLSDQIVALGLESVYAIEKARIIGTNGTEFIFSGLKNSASLKSTEALDRVWCEEASVITRGSMEILLPTVRKENSEIWISMNPSLESDDAYQRWVINPPPNAIVRKINYDSNPFFPSVLRDEMELLRETDHARYLHVWEGFPESTAEGAIYAAEMMAADAEKRITRVPYDPSKPVLSFWDLGYGDATAIWLAQAFPFEFRLLEYIEDSRKPLHHYLKLLQERPYLYGTDYLPWDGGAKSLGTGRSIEDLMREAGRTVEVVPQLRVADGINAARTIFGQCFFDAEKCADGIQALRHYRYGTIQTLGVPTRAPLHDENSHCADAFRTLAVGIQRPERPRPYQPKTTRQTSWMG